MKLLLFEHSIDEVTGLTNAQYSKYLYVIQGFESPSGLKLVHHISAKSDSELGKGLSIKSFSSLPEKIRCSANQINYLIEGYHFHFTTNGIKLT